MLLCITQRRYGLALIIRHDQDNIGALDFLRIRRGIKVQTEAGSGCQQKQEFAANHGKVPLCGSH
jgi:hypothetical protein